MNAELKDAWIEALRGGEYRQGRYRLKAHDGRFCCLGVLCDIAGRKWTRGNKTGVFPREVRLAGVSRIQAEDLASMNDTGETFTEIADYIEETL